MRKLADWFARYCWALFSAALASPLFPSPARTVLFRVAGLDIHSSARIAAQVHVGSKRISIARDVFINIGTFLDGTADLAIAEHVRIGPYVRILTGTHEYRDSVIRRSAADPTIASPVVICRGCWIGAGSTIMPGVTLAEGCVVGAGSVVLQSTEPNGLYAGSPAVLKRVLSTADDAGDSSRERE